MSKRGHRNGAQMRYPKRSKPTGVPPVLVAADGYCAEPTAEDLNDMLKEAAALTAADEFHEQRLALRPGDRVTVRMDDGTEKVFTVKYSPWQLGHGEWVIGLTGIAGGYALSRVVGIGFAV